MAELGAIRRTIGSRTLMGYRGDKTSAAALEVKEWRAEALRLRVGGKSIRQIAALLGKAPSSVHQAVEEEIAAVPLEAARTLRETMAAQIDALIEAHLPTALGEITADGVVRDAANIVLKAHERKAKLFGLDARQELNLSGAVTLTQESNDQLLDRIARLAAAAGPSEDCPEPESSGSDVDPSQLAPLGEAESTSS